jgi:hypothetical protein
VKHCRAALPVSIVYYTLDSSTLSLWYQADAALMSSEDVEPCPIPEPNPCVQHWANLADESTKKHLGIFKETRIFLSVCCHGTALVMCDMIESGEL